MSLKNKMKLQPIAKKDNKILKISATDQKILWGKAAGRCSICRTLLTMDTKAKGTAALGEMCHIIGESVDGPRGRSPMLLEDRNSYQNLILLCAHHHKIIDKDILKYPVEILHQLKTNHELWVHEKLGNAGPDPEDLVYSNLIDKISVELALDSWIWFIDNAVRDLLHADFLEARDNLSPILLGTVWPKKKPLLKKAIIEVVKSFCEYVKHFESNAEPSASGEIYREDKSYKRFTRNPFDYEKHLERSEKWSEKNFCLLCDYVVKLNNFAKAVRRFHNPMFYRLNGDFLVYDSMGYRFNMKSTIFSPSAEEVKRHFKKIESAHLHG